MEIDQYLEDIQIGIFEAKKVEKSIGLAEMLKKDGNFQDAFYDILGDYKNLEVIFEKNKKSFYEVWGKIPANKFYTRSSIDGELFDNDALEDFFGELNKKFTGFEGKGPGPGKSSRGDAYFKNNPHSQTLFVLDLISNISDKEVIKNMAEMDFNGTIEDYLAFLSPKLKTRKDLKQNVKVIHDDMGDGPTIKSKQKTLTMINRLADQGYEYVYYWGEMGGNFIFCSKIKFDKIKNKNYYLGPMEDLEYYLKSKGYFDDEDR